MSKLNIAQRCIERYDSKDFKDDYKQYLFEDFRNNEHEIIKTILSKFNVENYETEKALSNWFVIDKKQAKLIYDFIAENFDSFVSRFNGYYVGYTSLASIAFGEQEEQLNDLYNHSTGKDYGIAYLRKIFEKEDYYVNKDYAYYVVSGGLHVDLLNDKTGLNVFLLTLKYNICKQD